MRTEELIQRLAVDLRPVPRGAVPLRLLLGVAAGTLVSAALFLWLIGPRPDLMVAMDSTPFRLKVTYLVSLAVAALWMITRLARPETATNGLWIVALPLFLYFPVGIWELATTNRSDWGPMLLGHGWKSCTWLVLGLAVPIYAGMWWAFQKFAPTHFEIAGAAAGIGAGAVAGILYSFHCPSNTAVFALTWYTISFALAGAAGAALGRQLLRW